jgi:hypothetical protein
MGRHLAKHVPASLPAADASSQSRTSAAHPSSVCPRRGCGSKPPPRAAGPLSSAPTPTLPASAPKWTAASACTPPAACRSGWGRRYCRGRCPPPASAAGGPGRGGPGSQPSPGPHPPAARGPAAGEGGVARARDGRDAGRRRRPGPAAGRVLRGVAARGRFALLTDIACSVLDMHRCRRRGGGGGGGGDGSSSSSGGGGHWGCADRLPPGRLSLSLSRPAGR